MSRRAGAVPGPPSSSVLRRVQVLLDRGRADVRPGNDRGARPVVLLDPGLLPGHVLVRELDAQLADPVRVLGDEGVDRTRLERRDLLRPGVELDELDLAGLPGV